MSKANMILNMLSLHKRLVVRAAQMGVRNISCSSALRKNYYETLGLTRDATQADIKNAYFELSKLYHPDRIAATDENLAKFREVSTAYEILGNEQSRRLYDRGLLGGTKPFETDEKEPTDPIVKFYKKRQDMSKDFGKPYDDVEAWAKTYYTLAKKSKNKQQELYRADAKITRDFTDAYRLWFEALVICASTFLYLSNFEDTVSEKIFRRLRNTILEVLK